MKTELFPVLSIALKECIEDKISKEADFKLDDFGEDAVKDVIERLKAKRTTNNRELKYLRALFERATLRILPKQRLVNAFKLRIC